MENKHKSSNDYTVELFALVLHRLNFLTFYLEDICIIKAIHKFGPNYDDDY